MKAWTKYPNTVETDVLEKVPHIVEDRAGNQIEVMALDPINAIVLVTEMMMESLND
jgi:hypothetical protein